MAYGEIIATVSSKSAGPGTRKNIDEFTRTSRELSMQGDLASRVMLNIVATHHERGDGSGYPFSQARRLAIESNGQVMIYDTLDHQIGGVSQQQSGGYSVTFSSQYGYVDLNRLPVVSINGVAPLAPTPAPAPQNYNSNASYNPASGSNSLDGAQSDTFSSIEKLATLQSRGILSEQEFATRKAELLRRL